MKSCRFTHRFLRASRHLSSSATISKIIPDLTSAVEQAVPIVLVAGEGLNSLSWKAYGDILALRGYSGLIFEPDYHSNSIDDVADEMNVTIKACGLTPPIIISHSFSSLMCQRK